MTHICKYFLVDAEGIRRCVECGKSAQEVKQELKADTEHEDKALDKPEDKAVHRRRKRRRS